GRKLLRRCGTDGSYMSASDKRVHFGLGTATQATITVRWPSGAVDVYPDLPADRAATLREGAGRSPNR
ncbi:MAG TPA: ASPIC/UnbV domain-containing protein, partial [Chthonomonadaceae bacterium]|nr:ASPIC/UnbV domain-containing protein [Chthonomonadaceae bacterium]